MYIYTNKNKNKNKKLQKTIITYNITFRILHYLIIKLSNTIISNINYQRFYILIVKVL